MVIDQLLASDDPAVRYLTRVLVIGDDDRAAQRERRLVPQSPIVRMLLSRLNPSPYHKWTGPHWVLAFLSELGYPRRDRKLKPLIDRCAKWALEIEGTLIERRWRRCASQQGYALLYLIKLGFADKRCDELAERLMMWQWRDGGWNCDKRPEATHSSFHESLLPMRALFLYAEWSGRADAMKSAKKAAEMFLQRRLFRRKSSGAVIDPRFLELHFPYHWRYNILHALKALAEAGIVSDRRCREALEVLRRKQLPDGGFASAKRPYNLGVNKASPESPADFGPYGARRANPFVTIDALYVLRRAVAGRGSGG